MIRGVPVARSILIADLSDAVVKRNRLLHGGADLRGD